MKKMGDLKEGSNFILRKAAESSSLVVLHRKVNLHKVGNELKNAMANYSSHFVKDDEEVIQVIF